MTVFGISMMRDEDDILPYTLPRMAAQLDYVLVCDNLSADPTLLYETAYRLGNVTVIHDPEPAYFQSIKMTRLADQARELGADIVVPFDADEVWVATGQRPLKDVLAELPQHFAVFYAALYDHVVTGLDESSDSDPVTRIAWRRSEPLSLPKVAARILPGLVIEAGNHGAHYPGEVLSTSLDITIHHFPYRSVEQMARKSRNGAAAYAAAGDALPHTTGQHWRDYGRFLEQSGIGAIEEIFTTWFYEADPREKLTWDPCPLPLPSLHG